MRNDNEHDPHNANSMTLSKRLKIIYKEGFCQVQIEIDGYNIIKLLLK